MKSELTAFLDTIDTPAFRRANQDKVRAKAVAVQQSHSPVLTAQPDCPTFFDVLEIIGAPKGNIKFGL